MARRVRSWGDVAGRSGSAGAEDGGKARQVVLAAQELFGELGFEKTGIRDIAERANVALATVYAHVEGGKAGLLERALEERLERLVAHVLASTEADPVERFLDSVRRLNGELVRDPFLRRVLSERWRVSDPRLRERGREIERLFDTVAVRELENLASQGLVRCADPAAVATLIRVATQGWLAAADYHGDQVSHDRMLDTLLDAVRDSITMR